MPLTEGSRVSLGGIPFVYYRKYGFYVFGWMMFLASPSSFHLLASAPQRTAGLQGCSGQARDGTHPPRGSCQTADHSKARKAVQHCLYEALCCYPPAPIEMNQMMQSQHDIAVLGKCGDIILLLYCRTAEFHPMSAQLSANILQEYIACIELPAFPPLLASQIHGHPSMSQLNAEEIQAPSNPLQG